MFNTVEIDLAGPVAVVDGSHMHPLPQGQVARGGDVRVGIAVDSVAEHDPAGVGVKAQKDVVGLLSVAQVKNPPPGAQVVGENPGLKGVVTAQASDGAQVQVVARLTAEGEVAGVGVEVGRA